MQRAVVRIGRIVFVTALAVLLSVIFIVEIFHFSSGQQNVSLRRLKSSPADKVALASSAGEDSNGIREMESETVEADARPILIRKYLEKYKSPLVPYSDLIFELSQTYGFEYYWIVAIAQQESNLCKKIPLNSHNCWGYGINSAGTLRFENYEIALKSYAEYLKREYFDKGYTTTEQIMKKYCPHSNGSWAYGVNKFIDELETGNF